MMNFKKNTIINRVMKGVGANSVSVISSIITQILLVPIIITHWGTSVYGVWIVIATLPTYLALSDFGFSAAATNDMTAKIALGDQRGALAVFQSVWLATLALFLIGISIIGLVHYFSLAPVAHPDSVASDTVRQTVTLMATYGLLAFLGNLFYGVFRAGGRYALGTLMNTGISLSETFSVVAVLMAGGDMPSVALTYVIVRFLGLVTLATVLGRSVPWLRFGYGEASVAEVMRLRHVAAAVMAVPFGQALFLQAPPLFVSLAAGPAAVVSYTTVRTLTRLPIQISSLVNHALLPEFTRLAALQDGGRVRVSVALTVLISLTIGPAAFLVFVIGGPWLISFWTRGHVHPELSQIAIMALAMVLNILWHPQSNLLSATNRHGAFSYLFAIAAGLSALGTYPLTLWLGLNGAALSMFLMELFMIWLVFGRIRRYYLVDHSFLSAFRDLFKSFQKK